MDIGEELIRLGHAVSFQETFNEKVEGDNLGCLQRMLVSLLNKVRIKLKCLQRFYKNWHGFFVVVFFTPRSVLGFMTQHELTLHLF